MCSGRPSHSPGSRSTPGFQLRSRPDARPSVSASGLPAKTPIRHFGRGIFFRGANTGRASYGRRSPMPGVGEEERTPASCGLNSLDRLPSGEGGRGHRTALLTALRVGEAAPEPDEAETSGQVAEAAQRAVTLGS